ncbi:MAG: TRAP transporter substrate-binding protein [Betaproteobacteria bacterium]|nr:TRAP transporter substrate-binding protein [Betaproteobacteria bacterium]
MKTITTLAFVTAALFAGASALAQDIRVGNATAKDTQAAANDKLAELITKYSNGKLKATAHHGESLGNNQQMIRALQAGSVHGMVFPAGFLSPVVPELAMFDMPFLLPGAPAGITAFAAQSKAASTMKGLAEQKGVRILGFHGIGPQSFLTNFPVTKLADIQGKKFRVIFSAPRVGAYKDWGGVARPMELGEVYTALQQKTLDGMENPPDVIFKMKLHEAARYYTVTEHFAFVSNVIVSKKWYDSLSQDLKNAVDRAGADTIKFADVAYTKSQGDSLEAMRKAITVTNMPAAELQKMKELATKGVWEAMKADPQRGPIVKMLSEDVARFTKK